MALPTSAPRDFTLLFAARICRLFAYGFLAVVLVLYLRTLGFSETRIGVLLAFTLLTGIVYPLAVAGIGRVLFPDQVSGSLLMRDGKEIDVPLGEVVPGDIVILHAGSVIPAV